jgi:hypothetical protein
MIYMNGWSSVYFYARADGVIKQMICNTRSNRKKSSFLTIQLFSQFDFGH